MTFEEFFAKKKIDLSKLKEAEPALFAEFARIYPLMGDKSFDHSKKFLFNKLRRVYHTPEVPKAEKPQQAPDIAERKIAAQAEELSSPTISQKPGFTPRFKSKPVVSVDQTDVQEQVDSVKEPAKQTAPGFKPKFVPGIGVKKKADVESSIPTAESDVENGNNLPKSSYKPRFNASNLKATETQPGEEKNTPEIEKLPGDISTQTKTTQPFKPRFNAKNIKPKGE